MAYEAWPVYDPAYAAGPGGGSSPDQRQGPREALTVPADVDTKGLEAAALADEKVKELIGDKKVRKVVAVPGRLVNIVVG